jgi:hypothetical protein
MTTPTRPRPGGIVKRSQKQSIITAALSWKATADAIDRRVREGRAEVVDDLKAKLNYV